MVRKKSAAMEQRELEIGKPIEYSAVNHVSDRERRISRVAAYGAKPVSCHLLAAGDPFRMHDHQDVQFLGLTPEWIKVFADIIFSDYVGRDGHARKFEIANRMLQNSSRTRRILERHG